jgi:hypothetical protein
MRTGSMVLLVALTFALLSCGSRKSLTRPAGMAPVPTAIGAKAPASSDQLMEHSVQAKPDRSAEPILRSQQRQDDPFDLPPAK